MGQYRIDSIAQLARQMRFTPIPRRLQQLDAAEDLLLKLSPDQAYSLAEIVCALTGYEPKSQDGGSLTGLALQNDLGVLLEEVSDSLQLHVKSSAEPILGIDDVAQRLSVTSKTVQRWRRRGLPARRYTFDDGKRRIGFRLSSIERFVGSPSGVQEMEPARPSPSKSKSLAWLLGRLETLAQAGYWDLLAAQRLSKQAGIAPLAMLQIIREHSSVLLAPAPDADVRRRVLELRGDGRRVMDIARELQLPSYAIYRIELEDRLHRAVRKPIRFYDDAIYHSEGAADAIEAVIEQEPIGGSAAAERMPQDLPPYLRDLYRIPMLSVSRERGLFLKYHYLRYLASSQQKQLDLQISMWRQLRCLENTRRAARCVRAKIVEANLRLVVSVARKHMRTAVPLMDLVSEGNVILMRAVDSFDIHRGHRFSTYAVYALMRGFARYVPSRIASQRGLTDPELLAELASADQSQCDVTIRDEVDRLLSRLSGRERDVLSSRFGLKHPEMTCREVGQRLKLSSQRILQIEHEALAKLRGLIVRGG